MESWISCGIIASSVWGIYVVLLKKATSEQHCGLTSSIAFFMMSLGILVTSLGGFLFGGGVDGNFLKKGMDIAFASGLLWSVGMISVTFALSSTKTPVSRLTPLYNTNTLVAVLMGMLLLNEVPEHRVAILIGAVLVILGGTLVTWKPDTGISNDPASTSFAKRRALRRIFASETWITWGIIASAAWGSYAVLLKKATSPEYYGINPFSAFLAMSLGILVTSLSIFAARKGSHGFSEIKLKPKGAFTALSSGILWGVGMISVIYALSRLGASVASLVPLYNTNTLIAMLLGFFLLGEIPKQKSHIISTITGAILVVGGGALVIM